MIIITMLIGFGALVSITTFLGVCGFLWDTYKDKFQDIIYVLCGLISLVFCGIGLYAIGDFVISVYNGLHL